MNLKFIIFNNFPKGNFYTPVLIKLNSTQDIDDMFCSK